MRYTGHRGAMGYLPENTLASFTRAVVDGVDEIELDVRLSRDGVVVVIHDATVDRTTDGRGAVADLTVRELQRLDAGEGQHIPTLDEVLDAVDIHVFVEIKCAEVVEPLIRTIASDGLLRERIDVIGFHEHHLTPVLRALPGQRVGLLSSVASTAQIDKARQLGAAWVGVGWDGTTPDIIDYAHAQGLEYGLWPAPTRAEMERARMLGADEVTTNYPNRIPSHS